MTNQHYLTTIWALWKKEMFVYFNSPIAYVVAAIFLVVTNWLFFNSFFLGGLASVRAYFDLLPWVLLFFAPAITMRLWAEEKQTGTVELLLTLPLTSLQAVLAKFLSSLSFLILVLALSLPLPLTISRLGQLDWGPIIGAYLGASLLGAAYLSLGLFISSLTKNQIVAFTLSLAVGFLAFVIGVNFVIQSLPALLAAALRFLSLGNHFYNLSRGVIDTADLIYYLSFCGFFLWLNSKAIKERNWR